MTTEKDRLLLDLKRFISNETSSWLTYNDQVAIERKIDELDLFINERYKSHGRSANTYT